MYRRIPEGRSLPTNTPSRVSEALREAFGEFPIRLDSGHHAVLSAMGAADTDNREFYKRLADVATEHEPIEVYRV